MVLIGIIINIMAKKYFITDITNENAIILLDYVFIERR